MPWSSCFCKAASSCLSLGECGRIPQTLMILNQLRHMPRWKANSLGKPIQETPVLEHRSRFANSTPRFVAPLFTPMICYFKAIESCATSRATIHVPLDFMGDALWHAQVSTSISSCFI